jgi:hypothetical protein
MRKLTFLKEDQIYLQQLITQTLDKTEKEVSDKLSAFIGKLGSVKFDTEKEAHLSPEFINFKSENNLFELIDSIGTNLISSIQKLGKIIDVTIEQAALLSIVNDKFNYTDSKVYGSEIEKLLSFFGHENSDIPESSDNQFKVIVKEEGKKLAIKNFAVLSDSFYLVKEKIISFINKGGDIVPFKESFSKLFLLDEISKVLLVEDLKVEEEPIFEEVLNEESGKKNSYGLVSWSVGILPNKDLDGLWNKTVSILPKEYLEKIEKDGKINTRKDKLREIRAILKKGYDSSDKAKKEFENTAELVKKEIEEVKAEQKKKKTELKEDLLTVGLGLIGLVFSSWFIATIVRILWRLIRTMVNVHIDVTDSRLIDRGRRDLMRGRNSENNPDNVRLQVDDRRRIVRDEQGNDGRF